MNATSLHELAEDGARRGGLPNGQCSKGWGARCARSFGRKCQCACGGANHGKGRSGSGIVPGIHMHGPPQSDESARFRIEQFEPERIVIRDLGPWDKHQTVTNDAEGVIARLMPAPQQRVFYYDSSGRLDELVHESGRFARFAPATREMVAR
jgi:hypothetical protein